ncbi:hypothetical protein LOTGIDRAFT_113682 [Lottia gigantea]|uniref:45 kDa calcium-binding protein n=1 Tax=Lottia gigantea TaxID=225164 RepID=V4AW11_LOTGI|nr:hypothetical protein LOTGIDRAFT_113682 [Lottia gigantea]ESO99275.1 hypothetical protein LOTGIDRAFT_113682 [Lottia gigantea]
MIYVSKVYSKPFKFVKGESDKLTLDKLKPQDHIDALKMEHDGHINKEYHKELFLGDHEEIESDSKSADAKMKDIFKKVDLDTDGSLSELEMEDWIKQKMQEHFDEAITENEQIFKHLDPDGNGKVHWKEYYVHFLLAMDVPEEKARKHVIDYDIVELDSDDKEDLIRYKFRWADADEEPEDNELTKEEFLSFRHPEQSPKSLNNMVFSIINALDKNGDNILTVQEFAALPPGEVEGEDQKDLDRQWQKERENEFHIAVDIDRDGKATKEEVHKYIDPRNPIQAKMEAKSLISLIDVNKDNKLSIGEIMDRKDIFLSSKLADFARNVHDEF